ncbi:MAG: phosphatidylinositol mannoside acyltransferase [Actinomycetota bacterium]|nr:phosphatidylinositol mannoside acyltransferase [Actinomycetota bacterium]
MKGLLSYLLFRGVSGLFGLLPEPAVRHTGRGIGRLLSYVAKDRLALQERHMRRVLGSEATGDQVTAAAREMFSSYGRYWAEVFWFRPRREDAVLERTDVLGLGPLREARDSGRGVIFVLPHSGNWEAAGPIGESLSLPVLAVAEDLPNPRITDWFVDTRAAFGIEVVLAGRGSMMRRLARGLREGQSVALVADRDVTGKGVEVEFFGEMTSMPAGAMVLAEMTGAAIFPVGPYFNDGAGYRLVVHEPMVMPDVDDRGERIRVGTQQIARKLEEIIRERPTQWHLFQPLWPSDRAWLEERG